MGKQLAESDRGIAAHVVSWSAFPTWRCGCADPPGPADRPAPAKSLAVRLVVFRAAAPGRRCGATAGQTRRVRAAGRVGRARAGQLGCGRRSRRGAGLECQLAAASRAAGRLDDLPARGKARPPADRGRLRHRARTTGWIGGVVCLGASPFPHPAVRLAAGLLPTRQPDHPAAAGRAGGGDATSSCTLPVSASR